MKYLSIQDAGRQFPLNTAIVGQIHPQQELPASGEGDGQRVEDFSGVYARGETVREVICFRFWVNIQCKRYSKISQCFG